MPVLTRMVGFLTTSNPEEATAFYRETLGFRLMSEDDFALVFDANGTMIRVGKAQSFTPAQGTVLGWDGAIFTLFLAAFLGSLVALGGLLNGRLRKSQYIPFGPFLNTAGVMLLFYLCSQRDLLSLVERFQL